VRNGFSIVKSTTPTPESAAGAPSDDLCEVRGADPARVRLGRECLLSAREYAELAETFRALADASRAKIVHSLLRQELCTCDLAAIAGISEPAVSQHLRYLKDLHMVKTRREGRKVYYSLDDAHVRFLFAVTLRHQAHSAADASEHGAPDAAAGGAR
jgi:ArsR family transcriptional regulator, lead/cadmium/zinc/bismuth-responsive transcriptional repressor